MTTLTTERLVLRPWRSDDFEEYARIHSDPEVMRYVGDGQPLTRANAWRNLAMIIGHWTLRGFGLWAVEERSSGRLAGRAGFYQPDGWPGFEAGWLLAREFWGKGYATEAAREALKYAFTGMERSHVISLIYPDNARSIKVAERLGERLEGSVMESGHEVLVFGIDKSDWRD
ncbi:MAG TPA: GNAT family N-acetyltransferase [Blastocatellia bacterium]|nr:GNAT family N-acetyltransferase [Blastocatellia bacterium]